MKIRITLEGKTYDVGVQVLPDPRPDSWELPETMELPPPPTDLLPSDRLCRSPIAGLVVAVAACVGCVVAKDEPLVTIEAMKMQTAIGAPVDGIVEEVHVSPGESVKPGQLLCTLT